MCPGDEQRYGGAFSFEALAHRLVLQVPGVLDILTVFRPGFHVVGGQLRATSTLFYPTIASMFLEVAFAAGLWLMLEPSRRWERPDEYDITRRNAGHVGFGTGIHGCVGAVLARLEGEVVLSALARKVASTWG